MRRREFITLLGGAAIAWPFPAAVAWPTAAMAQQRSVPVVGFLRDGALEGSEHFVAAVRRGLQETGLNDGQNVAIEFGWTNGRRDRLQGLAAEFVRRPVSVIVASAVTAALAAKDATSTVPIVFAIANDPVSFGLVKSMNRPGGNVTGVSYLTSVLGGKRLGLIRELLPMTKEVAVLGNPNTENTKIFIEDVEIAARAIDVKISVLNAVKDSEIDDAFASLSKRRVDAVLVVNDTLFTTQRSKIAVLAARNAIPAIYTTREFTEAGGLMSYGPSLIDVYRQAGVYAGRIIGGEKPIDLPVLQPIKFELVINLKTLKALGFTLPPILFALADEVIE